MSDRSTAASVDASGNASETAAFTYAIIGTGALGGFYGARLQQAGATVRFLLRRDYQQVKQQGLVVESPDGNFSLPQVEAYADVAEMPPCDVAIVSLKTTQNHLLPKLLPPVVKDRGVVLVLQNGLGIESAIAEIVGSDRVLGGMCFLCANKTAPGQIRHIDYKPITLGDYAPNYAPKGITDRMRQIAQDFERAGVPIEFAEDLLIARWKKLMWNIPFNGLSVILDATTDEMMANVATRRLALQLMQEVQAGAAACTGGDRQIPDAFVETLMTYTASMKPYRTSMKLDYDERRPLELEAIFGKPLQFAEQAGAKLPQIATLYQQLQFLDDRNRA